MKYIFILFVTIYSCLPQFSLSQAIIENDSATVVKSKKFLLLPLIFNSPVTSWGFGGAGTFFFKTSKNDSLVRTSNVQALGLYTLHKQTIFLLEVNAYSPKETYILRWRNSFSLFPDRYWGQGNKTPESNEEDYSYNQYLINPQLLRRIYKKIYIGPYYEFQKVYNVHYKSDGTSLFDLENISGRKGSKVSGLGLALAWDTRNNAFSPNKGILAQLSFLDFSRVFGSDFRFTTYSVDLRQFTRLFNTHVIAFQFFGFFNTGDPPIRNMAMLGGSEIMRGYYAGRYRDKNFMATQVEYRMPVWRRFGVVGFAGIGEVQNQIKNFNLSGLKYSAGGGLRFALSKKEKLNLRIDYGFGYHSHGLYVTVSEAF